MLKDKNREKGEANRSYLRGKMQSKTYKCILNIMSNVIV